VLKMALVAFPARIFAHSRASFLLEGKKCKKIYEKFLKKIVGFGV
jgi:hypothetical protein